MPPPAEGFAARFVVGPALRTQPDRRLVTLVRDGYEHAFEEIVRRYGGALTRYAAAIVGSRADDVTQDAFSKALLAMRRDGREIELRPWLFRIVRNTALNDLRDRPPSAAALAESMTGGDGPQEELERREELTDLMRRLQALPAAQRAAIVMRELEGLSHEEIAAALGLSGGAARQAIFRARRTLRDAAGMLLPLPLLKALLAGAAALPAEPTAGVAGAGGAAGAGLAIKAAAATVLVAGTVGAGVAIDHGRHDPSPAEAAAIGTPGSKGSSHSEAASAQMDDSGSGERSQAAARHGHGRDDSSRGKGSREGGGGRHEGRGSDDGAPGPGGGRDAKPGEDRGSGSTRQGETRSDDGSTRSGRDGGSSGGSDDSAGPGGDGSSGDDGETSDGSGSGSISSGEDSGSGSSEGSGSGSGSDSGEISSSESESPGSGDSGDPGGSDGFSMQTEPPS